MRAALLALEPPGPDESLVNRVHRRSLLYGIARTHAWKEQMDAALDRIESGTFRICCDCEESIRERRLIAQPWSKRCTVCEERHELSTGNDTPDYQSANPVNQLGRHA